MEDTKTDKADKAKKTEAPAEAPVVPVAAVKPVPTHLRLADDVPGGNMPGSKFTFTPGVTIPLTRLKEEFVGRLIQRNICVLCTEDGTPV